MRLFFAFLFGVALLGFGCADGPTLAHKESFEVDVGAPHTHHIQFPQGWREKRLNREPLLSRADAPGATASMVVTTRDWRWQYERATTTYPDAWVALEGLTEEEFRRRFERGNRPDRERIAVREVRREMLGKEKAIFVDYTFAVIDAESHTRLRAYFVLRESRWYSVSLSTNYGPPDFHLAEMHKAVATFAFGD